jgi:hypothetical protein
VLRACDRWCEACKRVPCKRERCKRPRSPRPRPRRWRTASATAAQRGGTGLVAAIGSRCNGGAASRWAAASPATKLRLAGGGGQCPEPVRRGRPAMARRCPISRKPQPQRQPLRGCSARAGRSDSAGTGRPPRRQAGALPVASVDATGRTRSIEARTAESMVARDRARRRRAGVQGRVVFF